MTVDHLPLTSLQATIEKPATIEDDESLNPEPSPGWLASLQLRFVQRNDKTVLAHRRHRGPLRVQKPLYPESDRICHVYIIHPPGGIVGGDQLTIKACLEPEAWALLTTPGATRVYRSLLVPSTQSFHFRLEGNATLEWLPQETILFDGARTDSTVHIDLDAGSRFVGWDIACLGRPAGDNRLRHCDIRNRFQVWRRTVPLLIENSQYLTDHPVLRAGWGLRGCPVSGLLACTVNEASLAQKIRDVTNASKDALFSVSELPGILICRYLGFRAEEARSLFQQAWAVVRPAVLDAEPATPRIWNT